MVQAGSVAESDNHLILAAKEMRGGKTTRYADYEGGEMQLSSRALGTAPVAIALNRRVDA